MNYNICTGSEWGTRREEGTGFGGEVGWLGTRPVNVCHGEIEGIGN